MNMFKFQDRPIFSEIDNEQLRFNIRRSNAFYKAGFKVGFGFMFLPLFLMISTLFPSPSNPITGENTYHPIQIVFYFFIHISFGFFAFIKKDIVRVVVLYFVGQGRRPSLCAERS